MERMPREQRGDELVAADRGEHARDESHGQCLRNHILAA